MTPHIRYSLGLIGYPLEHSLSPRLHGAALHAMGLSGEYRLYPVPPLPGGEAALAGLLVRLRRGELSGLNVTIPHKQSVIRCLDDLSPSARAIGAVNTIWMQEGKLVGDNTDAPGFMADLQRILHGGSRQQGACDESAGRHALVLGAGGAARAVVYALLDAGWRVTVAARRLEQARDLVNSERGSVDSEQGSVNSERGSVDSEQGSVDSEQGSVNSERGLVDSEQGSVVGGRVNAIELDKSSISSLQSRITLVVNTTPLGMWPEIGANPWPQGLRFPDGALVYDLVYNPPETALLRAARGAGLAAANGLGMLVEQAALALERWSGSAVPRRPMWEAAPEFHDRFSAWNAATRCADRTQKEAG